MSQPRLVDFHCHLDLYADHEALVAECETNAVATVAVTTTPKAWLRNQALAKNTRHIRAALGLHPQLVATRKHELALFDQYLPEARYVGEVGLDAGPRFCRSFEDQREVFAHILRQCARLGGKILSIHSVRAARVVLDLLERHVPPGSTRVVLHWFSGTRAEAKRATDLGCYFSINSEMLRTASRRVLVTNLPLDRLLTETDGPFVRSGDRPAHPPDVEATVEALAELKGMTRTDMARAIVMNLRTLVGA